MMSGFRIDQIIKETLDGGDVCVLRKPFSMNTLLEKLEKIQQNGIVLVVDDDPDFSSTIKEYLAKDNYSVLLARNGPEAIASTQTNQVDVMILDLKLTIMHSLNVYLNLKEHGWLIPTIIVTGYAAEEYENSDILRTMSVTGCLFKPFDPEILLSRIDIISEQNNAATIM